MIKPIGNRAILKPCKNPDRTASGIILPESPVSIQGVVIASNIKTVKKGMTVIFSHYAPDAINIDGEEYLVVTEGNILAIYE